MTTTMAESSHPTYPHPTIQEAICEIIFQPGDDHPWSALTPLKFFYAVQDEFPKVESQTASTISIQFGSSETPQPVNVNTGVLRYYHASRPLLLQLSEDRIAINCVGNYPGWEQMRKDIQGAWETLVKVANPEKVIRIGVRYINRIERRSENETLGNWLIPTEYIPKVVLSSFPGFLSQTQVRTDQTNRLSITIGEEIAPSNSLGVFLFDIDRISERKISSDLELLLKEVDRLHEDVWSIFEKAKGVRLEKLLQGELL